VTRCRFLTFQLTIEADGRVRLKPDTAYCSAFQVYVVSAFRRTS
jgi:hypothetical protein